MIKSTIAFAAPLALAAFGMAVAVAPAEAQRRSPTCTQAELTRLEAQANRQAARSARRSTLIPVGRPIEMPRTYNPACMEHVGSSMRMSSR